MFGNNMNWNIPHLNNNPASGEPEPPCRTSHIVLPKPRKKFTLSHTLLSNAALPKIDLDDVNFTPSSASSPLDFEELPLLSKEKKSHHGSMENLYKPKNHRSTNRLSDLSIKTKESAEMNERLIQENMQLWKDLEETKKNALGLKVSSAFALNAFRSQKQLTAEIKQEKRKKDEEAAARMILHNLLLNSWRNCKAELDTLLEDNAQLNKSMENLSMQLRIVRHLQTAEKEKALEKSNEAEQLKSEIILLKDTNEKSQSEIERMENELNSLQANIQNLQEQNKKFEDDALALVDENENLGRSLDAEKAKSTKLDTENETLNKEASRLEKQLKEATKQNNHWQERARAFESESWELKLDIESRDSRIKEIKATCDALYDEKNKLMQIKADLKAQLDETLENLEQANFDKDELACDHDQAKALLKQQIERIETLESSLKLARKEYTEIEKELLKYKIQNVKRRREWANALYFLVNPLDAVRRSFTTCNGDRPYGSISIPRKSI